MNQLKKMLRRTRRSLQFRQGSFRPSIDMKVSREYFGSEYGGWDVVSEFLDSSSVVYSVGLGCDISFDLALIDKFSLSVFGFDPTPKSLSWLRSQSLPPQFRWYPEGLSDHDGSLQFAPPDNPAHVSFKKASDSADCNPIVLPVRRLNSIMTDLGHQRIDILKMDIEGSEYDVIPDLISSEIFPRQLLVEFHHRINQTGIARTKQQIEMLESEGYRIFSISDLGDEFSMVR